MRAKLLKLGPESGLESYLTEITTLCCHPSVAFSVIWMIAIVSNVHSFPLFHLPFVTHRKIPKGSSDFVVPVFKSRQWLPTAYENKSELPFHSPQVCILPITSLFSFRTHP